MKKITMAFCWITLSLSINAAADCGNIFDRGRFSFSYASHNQQAYGAVSTCGENKCFDGIIDFGSSSGRQRLTITYSGSTWWANWYDTSDKPLWLMGTCQGGVAYGEGGYKNSSSGTYKVTIRP
uniref:hypothetical protein n=1 Tax=Candidatus Electronema sp. TaxID=2698783 RepID=UPI0040559E0C